MSCVFEFDGDGLLSFYSNLILNDGHVFPSSEVAVLIWIVRVGFIHTKVFVVLAKDGQPPRAIFVVSDRDAWKDRFPAADHVPAWRDQMHPIP